MNRIEKILRENGDGRIGPRVDEEEGQDYVSLCRLRHTYTCPALLSGKDAHSQNFQEQKDKLIHAQQPHPISWEEVM